MHAIRKCLACAAMWGACAAASAQTNNSYPMLMSIKPAAARIGQTTTHEVNCRYSLAGATQVIVSGEGVSATVENAPAEPERRERRGRGGGGRRRDAAKASVTFSVAPDVVPGVRDFRIITPLGASTVGQIVLARDPVVSESAENDTADKAQPVALPAAMCGAIEKPEDRDFYKFDVPQGATYVFHVRSQRLLNRLHDMQTRVDPLIILRNAQGGTLATSDNHYAGDPLLVYRFERAGAYLLEIRDVRYQGNPDWMYVVEVNDRPFITQLAPLAVAPGTTARLFPVGFNLPGDEPLGFAVPAAWPAGLRSIAPAIGGQPANDVAVLVCPQPIVVEAAADNNTFDKAQAVPYPAVICGRIDEEADLDCYSFEAKSGERLTFDVTARRAWSGLDPYLRILNAQGAVLAEADDMSMYRLQSADARIENWSVPADGKYVMEIRDLHLRGGPQYTYAIEIERAQPHFLLELDTDKTILAPGMASVLYVRAVRKNGFAGDVHLAVEGLPPGVTAACGRILAGANDGCIILTAGPSAPVGAANIAVTGTAAHPGANGQQVPLSAVAQPLQEYYSPGGGRGHYPVDLHTVSVGAPMDLRAVRLSASDITLNKGESRRIDVTIERAAGFKGNVTLDVLYQHLEQPFGNSLPKGVTLDAANSKTLLTGDETQGHITLKAAADAPAVERQLIPVMAHVSINFVMKLTFAGEPVWVSVK